MARKTFLKLAQRIFGIIILLVLGYFFVVFTYQPPKVKLSRPQIKPSLENKVRNCQVSFQARNMTEKKLKIDMVITRSWDNFPPPGGDVPHGAVGYYPLKKITAELAPKATQSLEESVPCSPTDVIDVEITHVEENE